MTKAETRIEQGKRLKAARELAGFTTATEGASAVGVEKDTYIQHENGTRGFKGRAEHYARRFKVSPEWLLWGRKSDEAMARIQAAYDRVDAANKSLAEDLVLGTLERFAKDAS